jgi:hypothetical protein
MDNEYLNKIYNQLLNTNYKFDDYFKITYISFDQYYHIEEKLSILRKNNFFKKFDDYHILKSIFKNHYNNSIKRKELIRKQPRIIAQKFLSKKNVRKFIFKRDGFKCLKCGGNKRLQIDHINPISKGGENKLMNLQTLCSRCNSRKRDTYFDYRNNINLK